MATRSPRRSASPWGLILAAFIVLPLVEIYLIVQVGQVIGAWWTIVLLVLDSVVGVALVRREGTRAWRDLQQTIAAGRAPTVGLADGALLVVGAALMVTPGFVTDAVGLACVLPVTRPLIRRLLVRRMASRAQVFDARTGATNAFVTGLGEYGPAGRPRPPRGGGDGVVEGVVVETHDEPEPPRTGDSG